MYLYVYYNLIRVHYTITYAIEVCPEEPPKWKVLSQVIQEIQSNNTANETGVLLIISYIMAVLAT